MWTRRLLRFFSSLQLTVICLGLAMVLIFAATLDQVHLGVYQMGQKYFNGWFVWWPILGRYHVPVFPSGIVLGWVLLVNLITAHWVRFRLTWSKLGIWLVHLGLIVLLVGAGLTHYLSTESQMAIRVGEASIYSEHQDVSEVAIIRRGVVEDKVWSVPVSLLSVDRDFLDSRLPFPLRLPSRPVSDKVVEGQTYEIRVRPMRFYNGYRVFLEQFTHEQYPGTTIPKAFSSRVRIQDLKTGETHVAVISMNQPLRFRGKTFYQASFGEGDQLTVLQVVENPSWVFPYVACVMVGVGLLVQFLQSLVRFFRRSRS